MSRFFRHISRLWLPACLSLLLLTALPVLAQERRQDTTTVEDVMVEETETSSYEDDGENVSTDDADDTDYTENEVAPLPPELRKVADSSVARLKRQKEFAYANDSSYWARDARADNTPQESQEPPALSFPGLGAFRTVIYILLIGLILFVIYRIIVVNRLFVMAPARLPEEETDSEASIDDNELDRRIGEAIAAKEYRPATRLLFLQTLRSLNNKGWIRYHAQSTNEDYLRQLRQHRSGDEFRFLLYLYEYVWYGEFRLSETQFEQVQQHFQAFQKSI